MLKKSLTSIEASLVVSKTADKFSLSELVQIIELESGNILSITVIHGLNINAQITLHSENLNTIIRSIRRYDYTLISKHDEDEELESLNHNAAYLDKYLSL